MRVPMRPVRMLLTIKLPIRERCIESRSGSSAEARISRTSIEAAHSRATGIRLDASFATQVTGLSGHAELKYSIVLSVWAPASPM